MMTETSPILVVDDDEDIRILLRTILGGVGYAVLEAADGAAALAVIATVQPAVILLDMLMPGMDGWMFARQYRQMPGPHAPIIVVTAARDGAARAREIDAAGVVDKPFRMESLLACLSQILGLQRY